MKFLFSHKNFYKIWHQQKYEIEDIYVSCFPLMLNVDSMTIVHLKWKSVDNLNTFLEANQSPSLPLIICVDFNIDTLQENALSRNYLNCISSNGYEVFAKSATREADISSTCLDHFVYQNINLLNCEILKNQVFSDHDPIILTFGLCSEPERKTTFLNTAFLKKSEHCRKLRRNSPGGNVGV